MCTHHRANLFVQCICIRFADMYVNIHRKQWSMKKADHNGRGVCVIQYSLLYDYIVREKICIPFLF